MKVRPKIKICGITNYNDAHYSIVKGADFIGFIFYEKSPRYINPIEAGIIMEKIRGEFKNIARFVGVFVNPSVGYLEDVIFKSGIDMVQLHGDETVDFIESFLGNEKNKDIPVIKAMRIKDENDIIKSDQFDTDYILFDTYYKGIYGGTGKVFNWTLLDGFKRKENLFLSGGLDSKNIVDAVEKVNPHAVDISSSLESEPGKKDRKKVNEFFEAISSIN
ncbi:phosphoribosylanthranilate isomerase [Spirochaetota bacterium]